MPDLQLGGCGFESRPGLLRTEVYSAFHPSGVGKWVPAAAGKPKAGMAHSDCGWTCRCAGKTVKSLENTCHTWALLRWWFTTKRRHIKCMHLYLFTFTANCYCWLLLLAAATTTTTTTATAADATFNYCSSDLLVWRLLQHRQSPLKVPQRRTFADGWCEIFYRLDALTVTWLTV